MATVWARRALESRRVREWMAWRRYLIATRMSNGLAAYPSREEDAWARLLEDLAEVDSSGLQVSPGADCREQRKPACFLT